MDYLRYVSNGGKLSYTAWIDAGQPKSDGGSKPNKNKDGNSSGTTTAPQSIPPTYTKPQIASVNPSTGEVTYKDDPNAWKPAPNTATANPSSPPTQSPAEVKPPEATSYTIIYGGSVWQGSDGKYYDPTTGFPLSNDEVYYRYQKFLQGEVNPLNGGQSNPNAMTPYQQGSLDLQRQQFDWQQKQAQIEADRQAAEAKNKEWVAQYNLQKESSDSAITKQQNEMELIKGRAFPFGDENKYRQMMSENSAGAFESARQSILASLTQPSDWIKRWEVQSATNPYTPQPQSQLDAKNSQVENTRTRANMFDQMADEAAKLVTQLSANPNYGAGTPNEATVLTQARNDAVNYRNAAKAERDKLPIYQADVTYLQGQPQDVPLTAQRGSIAAPSWLPMFAPGQRAGQALTKESIATPSAQQWSAAPWSVQQGLAGYTDWAGGRSMADILGNMAQMLPNNPGGGARWSPYLGR